MRTQAPVLTCEALKGMLGAEQLLALSELSKRCVEDDCHSGSVLLRLPPQLRHDKQMRRKARLTLAARAAPSSPPVAARAYSYARSIRWTNAAADPGGRYFPQLLLLYHQIRVVTGMRGSSRITRCYGRWPVLCSDPEQMHHLLSGWHPLLTFAAPTAAADLDAETAPWELRASRHASCDCLRPYLSKEGFRTLAVFVSRGAANPHNVARPARTHAHELASSQTFGGGGG